MPSGIVRMTKAGLMPPWMPGPDSAADRRPRRAAADRRLSCRRSPRWAAAGAPAGRPGDRHSNPPVRPALGGPGRTITLAPPKAYSPHAAGGGIDDYHCFLLDPKLKQSAYVTAALIRPQRTGSVHHVILYEAAGAQATAATQLNAAHGGKGWSCFGGPDLPVDLNGTGRDRPARPAAVDRRLGARSHVERAARRDRRAPAQGREGRDAGALQPDRRHRPRPLACAASAPSRVDQADRARDAPRRRAGRAAVPERIVRAEMQPRAGVPGRDRQVRRAERVHPDRAAAALREDARRLPAGRRRRHAHPDLVRPRRSRARRRSTASRATCTCAARTSRSCSTRGRRRSRRCCTSRRGTSTGRTSTT